MGMRSITWLCGVLFTLAFADLALAREEPPMKPIDEVFEPRGEFPADRFVKVAVVQWVQTMPAPVGVSREVAEEYKQTNRETLEQYVREAASNGAKYVVTPEFGVVGYPDLPGVPSEDDNFRSREDLAPYVENVPGPSSQFFSALARELGVYVQFGLAEVDRRTDRYHNTAVVVDPSGEVVARYRKMHLFKQEYKYLVPGDRTVTFTGPFGKVGMIICSDVYGEPMDEYRAQRVNVLALSTSWAQMNTGMDHFKDGARAVRAYLLAANQTYFPDSGVINPDGTTQSHIRQSTGVAYGYLPKVEGRRGRSRGGR